MEPPPGWGQDELTRFIDLASQNQFATFQNLSGSYRRLRDLDGLFLKALVNLDNPEHWVPPFFFFRSHSAFRASVQLAMAGQIPESYMVMRGCLEFALYGVYMWRRPESWDTWCARNDSPETKKKVRAEFTTRTLFDAVPGLNPAERAAVEQLYDRTIDLGGHPNQLGLFGSLQMMTDEEAFHFESNYLMGKSVQLDLALRSTAQVGVAAFGLMGRVFETRYGLLGLWDALAPVKAGL
jgi:hypothetical protein